MDRPASEREPRPRADGPAGHSSTPSPPSSEAGKPSPPSGAGASVEQTQLDAIRRARQVRVAKVVVALAIIVILIIFIVANANPVPVNFVFVTRSPLLIWVMLGCAVLGGIAGYLIGRPGKEIRRSRAGGAKKAGDDPSG